MPDEMKHTPGKRFVPAYYRPVRRNPRIDPSADVSDVLHAWEVSDHGLGEIVVKILRLGRKPGTDRVQELRKICEHAVRALEFAEMEGTEDEERWEATVGYAAARRDLA